MAGQLVQVTGQLVQVAGQLVQLAGQLVQVAGQLAHLALSSPIRALSGLYGSFPFDPYRNELKKSQEPAEG